MTFDPGDELCTLDAPTFADAECHGDSGGLLLSGYGTATPVEVGITSYSTDPDCSTHAPDYFTRADTISGWAASWVAALAPPPDQRPASGAYPGDTSQHRAIAVHVAASRVTISSVRFRRYTIGGRFNMAGRVRGTLSVRLHKRSYGTCRSGLVRRSAGATTS